MQLWKKEKSIWESFVRLCIRQKLNRNYGSKTVFLWFLIEISTTLLSEEEFEKLKEATFVFFNKEYAPYFYDFLLEICAQYGFEPKVVHESNNISSIIQLVKNGLGISIVPTAIMKSHNYPELEYVEIKKAYLFTDILLATPKGNPSEISKAAIQFLMKQNSKK